MIRSADPGVLFAQDRALILDAMNQAVTRLHVYDSSGEAWRVVRD